MLIDRKTLLLLSLCTLSACDEALEADDSAPDGYHEELIADEDASLVDELGELDVTLDAQGDGFQDPGKLPPCVEMDLAWRAPVTVSGTYGGTPSVIVDGTFAPAGTVWNSSTYAVTFANTGYLEVDLEDTYPIDTLILQADCNDVYRVQGSTDHVNWTTLSDFNTMVCPGLRTRPTVALASVQARYLRVTRLSGDSMNSVSELQALHEECPDW